MSTVTVTSPTQQLKHEAKVNQNRQKLDILHDCLSPSLARDRRFSAYKDINSNVIINCVDCFINIVLNSKLITVLTSQDIIKPISCYLQ